MKISNETKVGALAAIAITILILGFNYLKGKDLTERSSTINAVFPSVEGLLVSAPVYINGFQIGKVSDIQAKDRDLNGIIVRISITKNVNIPDNSVATLSSEILQSTTVVIEKGSSTHFVKNGDTIQTREKLGLIGDVRNSLNPAISALNKTLNSLDILLGKVNALVDPNAQKNIQTALANLAVTTESLKELLNSRNGVLAKSLGNLESITGSFKNNSPKLDTIFGNMQTTSQKLATLKIEAVVDNLSRTIAKLDAALAKADSKNSSMGLLLNDTKLYDEIRQTNRSLNTLLDDFKTHPKRYVNISVFGKKDKSGPLQKPIYDSVSN